MARAAQRGGTTMITVYGYSTSGNCHKVRLLLEQLGRQYRWVEIDSTRGETRTPEYLAKNPNGKVPMLELDDGRILVESNAMLYWLAEGSSYFAGDGWERAQTMSWMFFEQYSHEPYVAVARFICGWTPLDSPRRADLSKLRARSHQALAVMEDHLTTNDWFSGSGYGIADIALFAYTDVAHHGGVDVSHHPQIKKWLARVRATPRFAAMPDPSAEAAALIAQSE
jgi:glutathione S-transferase